MKKFRSTLSTTIEVLGASRKYAFSAFYNAEEALNVISFLWQNRVRRTSSPQRATTHTH